MLKTKDLFVGLRLALPSGARVEIRQVVSRQGVGCVYLDSDLIPRPPPSNEVLFSREWLTQYGREL